MITSRKSGLTPAGWVFLVVLGVLLAVGVDGLAGCKTVTPDRVASTGASYDGAEANSGILSLEPGGARVTPHLRDRYNALVELYGKRFTPPVRRHEGFVRQPDGTYLIDNQTLERFLTMAEWRRAGIQPQ
jgi:hypothetical protein